MIALFTTFKEVNTGAITNNAGGSIVAQTITNNLGTATIENSGSVIANTINNTLGTITNKDEMQVIDTLTNNDRFLNDTTGELTATKIVNTKTFTNDGTTNASIVNNNAGGTMTNNNEMNVTDTLTNDYVFLNGADATVTDAVLSATKIENNNAFTNYGTTNAGIVKKTVISLNPTHSLPPIKEKSHSSMPVI